MDWVSLILPALLALTGVIASYLFGWMQKGITAVERLSPLQKQLAFAAFTIVLTVVRKYVPGIPLPEDPREWDVNAIQGLVSALIGMGVYAIGKRTTTAPVRLTSKKAGAR